MNQTAFQFPASVHRKVRMRRAVECTEHADAVEPKWSEKAYAFLCQFAATCDHDFLGEEVIYASKAAGVPEAADKRAWGSVFAKAAKARVIVRVGWSTSTRNASAKPVWRRV